MARNNELDHVDLCVTQRRTETIVSDYDAIFVIWNLEDMRSRLQQVSSASSHAFCQPALACLLIITFIKRNLGEVIFRGCCVIETGKLFQSKLEVKKCFHCVIEYPYAIFLNETQIPDS